MIFIEFYNIFIILYQYLKWFHQNTSKNHEFVHFRASVCLRARILKRCLAKFENGCMLLGASLKTNVALKSSILLTTVHIWERHAGSQPSRSHWSLCWAAHISFTCFHLTFVQMKKVFLKSRPPNWPDKTSKVWKSWTRSVVHHRARPITIGSKSHRVYKMTRWQIDKMTNWQEDKLTKWQIDKMKNWQDDKMSSITEKGL